jgi:hypothetical protein
VLRRSLYEDARWERQSFAFGIILASDRSMLALVSELSHFLAPCCSQGACRLGTQLELIGKSAPELADNQDPSRVGVVRRIWLDKTRLVGRVVPGFNNRPERRLACLMDLDPAMVKLCEPSFAPVQNCAWACEAAEPDRDTMSTEATARCEALCSAEAPPSSEPYCSERSQQNCREVCMQRVKDVSPICASCLLEDASFAPRGDLLCYHDDQYGERCELCGPEGCCGYYGHPLDFSPQRCWASVGLPQEDDCEPTFGDIEQCSEICSR